jgi:thioredoxin reductase/ferredoxin
MSDNIAEGAVAADGAYLYDPPVALPPIIDVLVVGGGPFGTAAAFRAKELGRSVLVIDYDDLMKRIRDYAKGKPILPDFGGGDAMQFPDGGALIQSLQVEEIDKDDMCARWKGLYRRFQVPAQVGVEMTGLEREGDAWRVLAWNHRTASEQVYRARHVVLAFGRGVPRRLEVSGNAEGLAFALRDPAAYIGAPACVMGGGTSAAEAVIAISNAKVAAGDPTIVCWSYRGDKMPKVSKALGDAFFAAFTNGNIEYLPKTEPVAFVDQDGETCLLLRTNRAITPGRPAEIKQLEFRKRFCIACIGEDIPEALLARVGVPLVTGGAANKKRIVVTPLLETRQPNVYLAGAVLSPIYLETTDFDSDAVKFTEIKRKDNIKAALRDGVVVAEVIDQKLKGVDVIEVNVRMVQEPVAQQPLPSDQDVIATIAAPPPRDQDLIVTIAAPPPPPVASGAGASAKAVGTERMAPFTLSALLNEVEVNEFRLKSSGRTTLGRNGDIKFPNDDAMADIHAEFVEDRDGCYVEDKGSAQGVFLRPASGRIVDVPPGTVLRAGRQWLMIGDPRDPSRVTHYDAAGRRIGTHTIAKGQKVIVGRQSPGITLAPDDAALSRSHLLILRRADRLSVEDLGSANGTFIKLSERLRLTAGDRLIIGRQTLGFNDERSETKPSARVVMRSSEVPGRRPKTVASPVRAAAGSVAEAPAAAPQAVDAGAPVVVFADGRRAACTKGDTILEACKQAGIASRGAVPPGIDYECEAGLCGRDPVRVVSGGENLGTMTSGEEGQLEVFDLEPGKYRFACMARVNGPVTIEVVKANG